MLHPPPPEEISLVKVAKAQFSAPFAVQCEAFFTSHHGSETLVWLFALTDAASAQPHVLLHAPLPMVAPSLRDAVKPPHRAHLPSLHLPGQADVHGQRGHPDPFPGKLHLESSQGWLTIVRKA